MSNWKMLASAVLCGAFLFATAHAQILGVGVPGAAPGEPGAAAEAPFAAEGAMPPGAMPDPLFWYKRVGDHDAEAALRIEKALRSPLHSSGLDFTDQPLNDVINQIQDDYGIPIQLDSVAMESAGIGVDAPVTVNIHNVSLQSALRLMLRRLNLTSIVSDEVLQITTPDVANQTQRICVYAVSTISGPNDEQLGSIVDLIKTCVATDSWAENGGRGQIRTIRPGLLVITQNAENHREINDLIDSIHKMRKGQAAMDPAVGLGAAMPSVPEEIVTRSYVLQLNNGDDFSTTRTQISDLIKGALPDQAWDQALPGGQAPTSLTVFKDRIVVRNTAEVQDKIKKLLADSGIATPLNVPDGNGGGFGGGGGGFGGGRFSSGGLGGGGGGRGGRD